ncbi:hypothetical protein VLK81_04330 [Citroniella saccharovorans]|uniref:Uncharacterized protein n=1 Tax=Citroniella saccharovorans TaxID=2053367 RepID=A0AAW9MYX4_9FIRM|nr:hypothetical protein [Citroniella saccharovorans]MEB3429252.1 hypothetical protein [Citroniella saccharovorans]
MIGTTNHPKFGEHWIIRCGYFTSTVDGNYVIVNNGWGNNNVWIEPSTTYLDGTIHLLIKLGAVVMKKIFYLIALIVPFVLLVGSASNNAAQRAAKIDDSIPYLSNLVFSIGGYFDGHVTTTITFYDECMKVKKEHPYDKESVEEQTVDYPDSKESFMQALQDLHFGKWKSRYDNPEVQDGTQWSLELHFSNGQRTVSFSGSNAYPDNFDDFCSLIGERSDGETADK